MFIKRMQDYISVQTLHYILKMHYFFFLIYL